jgi:hypothetical protein
MPVPWLRILDAVIGITDLARSRKMGRMGAAEGGAANDKELLRSESLLGSHLETRLASVVVAALKEAFDRDTHRLELEREQLAAERERAERALRLELFRQAVDREIGRLRLLAGVAVASWIGTLFMALRLTGGRLRVRAALGGGWILIIAAIAASFIAQSRVQRVLDRDATSTTKESRGGAADPRLSNDPGGGQPQAVLEDLAAQLPQVGGGPATLAIWLLVFGLALVALSVLLG